MTPGDVAGVASLLAALAEIPGRLAALEREQARMAAEQWRILAALPPMLVSTSEAARLLAVSVPTIRRQLKAKLLPIVKVGKTVRIDVSRLVQADRPVLHLATVKAARRRPDGE